MLPPYSASSPSIISNTSDQQTPLPAWKDYSNNKIKIVLSQGLSLVANAFIFLHFEGGRKEVRRGAKEGGGSGPRRLALLPPSSSLPSLPLWIMLGRVAPPFCFPWSYSPLSPCIQLIGFQTKLSAFELNHTIIIRSITLVPYQRESQRKKQQDIPTAIMKFFKP